MKQKTRFDLFFSCVTTAALLLFMSCGHQTRENDGLFADIERERGTESSEVNVPTEGEAKPTVSSELTEPTSAKSNESETKGDVSASQPAATPSNLPIDPTKLSDSKDSNPSENAIKEAPADSLATASLMDAAPPTSEALPPMEAKLEAAPAPLEAQDNKLSDPLAQMTVPLEGSPLTAAAEPIAKKVSQKKGRSKGKVRGAKAPELPTESVWKKGQTLNRYYFLRPNDSPESVAAMIYGDMSKAEALKTWNSGEWKTGKIIVFASATQPDDTDMKSLYDERELAAQAYTVKGGEKLSDIAQNRYGDSNAWVEIAAMNHLKNDTLADGMILNLMPAEIPAFAKAEPKASETLTAQQMSPEEKVAAIVEPQAPVKAEPEMKQEIAKKDVRKGRGHKKPQLANAEIGGIFEEHLAAIMGGALILMASFFAFRYFRRTREFQD